MNALARMDEPLHPHGGHAAGGRAKPVTPGAALEIQTTPGASCAIVVRYKSGPSKAKGLVPKLADGKGRIAWTWRVGSNTTPGKWPIEVNCQKGEARGVLKTSFEVR